MPARPARRSFARAGPGRSTSRPPPTSDRRWRGAAAPPPGRERAGARRAARLFSLGAAKSLRLSHHDERLEIELARDAFGHRAGVFARAVRAEVQAPELSANEHLCAFLQPRKLAAHTRLQRLGVFARSESADLHVDGARLLGRRPYALELYLGAAGLDEPELVGRGVRQVDDARGVERAAVVHAHDHAA